MATHVHNTREVLFRLCANTDPQRDSIFTKGPADVLDHATSEIAIGSNPGLDATKKLPGEGFKRPWPPRITMDEAVQAKVENLLSSKDGGLKLWTRPVAPRQRGMGTIL